MKKIFLIIIPVCALVLTGCFCSLGGDNTTSSVVPTVGQQLIDLQKAEQTGAITPEQYQAKKAELLKK